MIRWGHQEILYLLLLVPLLAVFLYYIKFKHNRKLRQDFASSALFSQIVPQLSLARKSLKDGLLLAALILVIIALADPQVGTRIEEIKREGIDLVVAVDVSRSMLAQDIAPSRLEKAKHEMHRLLDRLQGDRVALVAFAGRAVVECPLTLDYGAAEIFLDILEPGLISMPGTSLSAAIEVSLRAFPEESQAGQAVVLITDGEDHEAGVMEAVRRAEERGITIHAVGIGSPQGVPIPIGDFQKDREGNVVVTRLDEATLVQIAEATGGIYQRCSSGEDAWDAIIGAISGLEKGELGSRQFTQYEHRYQVFLILAFILLILEGLLSDRKMKLPRFLKMLSTEESP
jgi:Ca-activated chloride channel family protein